MVLQGHFQSEANSPSVLSAWLVVGAVVEKAVKEEERVVVEERVRQRAEEAVEEEEERTPESAFDGGAVTCKVPDCSVFGV